MSRRQEEFDQHPIHDILKTLWGLVDFEIKGIDEDHEAERGRLRKSLDRLSALLENLDPDLLQGDSLNRTHQILMNCNSFTNLELYKANPNIHNIKSINDYLIAHITETLQSLAFAEKKGSTKEIRLLENEYRKLCKRIKTENSQIKKDFNSLHKSFRDMNTNLKDVRGKLDAESKDIIKGLEENFTKYANEASAVIEEKHQSILDIHQMVAEDGVAAGYKKYADNEQKSAKIWRRVAMFFYILALGWLIYRVVSGFGFTDGGTFDWVRLLGILSVTAVALGVAQFASHQSRAHRENEQEMRWFSLEVKAIDPFIQSLPDKERHELKRQLSDRLFGKDRAIGSRPRKRFISLKLFSMDRILRDQSEGS